MNEWKAVVSSATIEAHRTGWRGVWDAVVSAVTRQPRLTVPVELTLSAWVKSDEGSTASLQLHVDAKKASA